MDNKKGQNFFFVIILLVTGSKLIQHTQFNPFRFEKPALDTVYLIAFLAMLFALIKNWRSKPKA